MKIFENKNIYSPAAFICITLLFSGFFQACEDNESEVGIPEISHIRLTDVEKSDSLVTQAFMGSIIAIVGDNLQDVQEIWFNDKEAYINTSYISNNAIIVAVPNEIPEVVTNELKLITRDKKELLYPFVVRVPAPLLESMLCEFVDEGETAVIRGNYFIDDPNSPLEVTFPGNIKGEVTDVALTEVSVVVPEGAGIGPVSMKTIYGSSRSRFYFRDDRNIIIDYDVKTTSGSWRGGTTREDDHSLDGKYLMLKGELGDNQGAEDYSGGGFVSELWSDANGRPNANFFEGDPANYLIKFESKVIEWTGAYLNICFGPWKSSVGPYQNQLYWGNINARALWRPWEQTGGKFKTEGWITVTIPMTDVKYSNSFGAMEFDPSKAGSMSLWMKGPAAEAGGNSKIEIYIDNVRIVEK